MRICNKKIPNSLITLVLIVAGIIGWVVFIATVLMNLMIMFPRGL